MESGHYVTFKWRPLGLVEAIRNLLQIKQRYQEQSYSGKHRGKKNANSQQKKVTKPALINHKFKIQTIHKFKKPMAFLIISEG